MNAQLRAIEKALAIYQSALANRTHGGIAASDFADTVQAILARPVADVTRPCVIINVGGPMDSDVHGNECILPPFSRPSYLHESRETAEPECLRLARRYLGRFVIFEAVAEANKRNTWEATPWRETHYVIDPLAAGNNTPRKD